MINLFKYYPRKFRILEISMIFLSVALLFLLLIFGNLRSNYSDKIADIKQQNINIKSQIGQQNAKVASQVAQDALSSSNPEIKHSSQDLLAQQKIPNNVNNLFKIFYNYSSEDEYKQRVNLCKPYLASKLLHSKNLFAMDKSDLIQAFESGKTLNSAFEETYTSIGPVDKNENVPVIVSATFQSWYSGTGKRGEGTDIYTGVYNLKRDKFVQLSRSNNLYTGTVGD